jgi:hypothetical protein
MNTKQLAVLNASRGYIKAKGAAVKAFQALCGEDLFTDEAKALVVGNPSRSSHYSGYCRIGAACSDAKSGPMAKAGRDYWAVTKSFSRAKAETVEKVESVPVGFADSIINDATKIIARIQKAKPEKLTFEAAAAIAGFQAAIGKIREVDALQASPHTERCGVFFRPKFRPRRQFLRGRWVGERVSG